MSHPMGPRAVGESPTAGSTQLRKSISHWENEGGAAPGDAKALSDGKGQSDVLLTNAELVQLQVRVIALENLVTALLAAAPSSIGTWVDERARSILPRAGYTPHHLTIRASAHILHLAQRSALLRDEAVARHCPLRSKEDLP